MKKIFVLEENRPDWCKDRLEDGLELHIASRPLYGNVQEDTWSLPCFHGRHYAGLDPADDRYEFWRTQNESLDARQLIFVSREAVLEAALEKLRGEYADELAQLGVSTLQEALQSEWLDYLLTTGLEALRDDQA